MRNLTKYAIGLTQLLLMLAVVSGSSYVKTGQLLNSSGSPILNLDTKVFTGTIYGVCNSTTYWDGYSGVAGFSWAGGLTGTGLSPTVVAANLNYKILSRWQNISGRPTHLSNFTNDLNTSTANSSNYWDGLNTPLDIKTLANVNVTSINKVYLVKPSNGTDIQAKLNLCDGIRQCTVQLGCGNHTLASGNPGNLHFKSNTHLTGSGMCSLITGNGRIFYANQDATNIEISGLQISKMWGIYFFNGTHDNLRVHNNYFFNCTGRCVYVNGSNPQVYSNYMINVANGVGTAEASGRAGAVQIHDNIITGFVNLSGTEFGEGIDVNDYAKDVTAIISHNYIAGFREQGIDCNVGKCIIDHNYVEMIPEETRDNSAIYAGMWPYWKNSTQVVIDSNVIKGISDYGIYLEYAKERVITNNVFQGIGKSSIGINVGSRNSVLMGNTFKSLNKSVVPSLANMTMIGNSFYNTTYAVFPPTYASLLRIDNVLAQIPSPANFTNTVEIVKNLTVKGKINIKQAAATIGLNIDQDGAANGLFLTGSMTGATTMAQFYRAVASTGIGLQVWSDSAQTGANGFFHLALTSATSSQPAEYIDYRGTGKALFVNMVKAAAGNGGDGQVYFYRNTNSTLTSKAVTFIVQDNAFDDQPALQIQQDGSAGAIQLSANVTASIACAAGTSGSIYYRSGDFKLMFCNSTHWKAIG